MKVTFLCRFRAKQQEGNETERGKAWNVSQLFVLKGQGGEGKSGSACAALQKKQGNQQSSS
jgi:hypothetical protein